MTGKGLLVRAAIGALTIVVLAAAATATAGLLAVDDLAEQIRRQPGGPLELPEVTKADAGKPQTLLLLGSDRRFNELKKNNPALRRSVPARSDTLMLVRLDPDQEATAVMSIPRDLKVDIPGHGTDKINAAYSLGGERLTIRTLKQLFGEDFKIHHVVNVNFGGFKDAVNALDCVYTDVDRRYEHSNAGLPQHLHYAEIDLQPGYQRLCGSDALDYVRFRHQDNDIVRAARQQDFLRAAKDQISTSRLISDRERLIEIFAQNTTTDRALGTTQGLLRLLKLGLFSASHPVREIRFPAIFTGDATAQFVEASPEAIERTERAFLRARGSSRPRGGTTARRRNGATGPGLVDRRREGEDLVAPVVARRPGLPIYFPTKLTAQGRYTTVGPNPRVYTLRDRANRRRRAYRLVVLHNEVEGQYYGVQGTTWRTPPVLAHPTSTRRVGGRELLLFRDGDRLRFVAWRTPRAAYWISNTLSLALTNKQMLGIAASLRRFS